MKRYTFDEIARRECAECTTTITTTKVDRYITEADHLADRASLLATIRQAVEAMELAYEYAEVNTCETELLAALAACREKLEEA